MAYGKKQLQITGALLVLLVTLSPTLSAADSGVCGRPMAAHPWCNTSDSPQKRAELLLQEMTLDEKIGLFGSRGTSRLGVPGFGFTDGPVGVGGALNPGPATGMPSSSAVAATFNLSVANMVGGLVGREAKHRGRDGLWGPNLNLARVPMGGRVFEMFGEDPYLASKMATAWIQGLQAEGVMSESKHYVANDQEGKSVDNFGVAQVGERYTYDAVIDERTLNEVYLLPFERAVKDADIAAMMCSFNRLNSVYMCESFDMMMAKARQSWGFQGYFGSDAAADHNTADKHLNAGMNVSLLGTGVGATQVSLAMSAGLLTEQTINARALEILRTLFHFGLFDRPAYTNNTALDDHTSHDAIALKASEQAITLLKNDGTLPIDTDKVHKIAVIGLPASQYVQGGGSAGQTPYKTAVTALDGITTRAQQTGIAVTYDDGSNPLISAMTASTADLAIVVVADHESEGSDRFCLSLNRNCYSNNDLKDQDLLIEQVAAANPSTVVVMETGAPVLTRTVVVPGGPAVTVPWRDSIAGLLEAWYPGMFGGTAIAEILFGDVEPSGRLPMTFPDTEADLPTALDPTAYPGVGEETNYKEGVMIGYRWYDLKNLTPAYAFGCGLSYTTFSYSNPSVRLVGAPGNKSQEVSVTITNTGTRPGWTVPQVYVGMPSTPTVQQPLHQLKGFTKLYLQPGESTRAAILLDTRAFSYWDIQSHDWRIAVGDHQIMIGDCSRDLALAGTVAQPTVNHAPTSSLSPATASVNAGDAVSFVLDVADQEGDDLTYDLDFGDTTPHATGTVAGTGSPGQTINVPAHTYASEGSYTAVLKVVEANTSPALSAADQSASVTVQQGSTGGPAISVNLSADKTSGDVTNHALTVNFTAAATDSDPNGGQLTYTFYYGDGTHSARLPMATSSHDYGAAGTYHPYVIVADDDLNSATSAPLEIVTTVTVTVTPSVNAALTFHLDKSTVPATATFDASGSQGPDGMTYRFDFGDGTAPVSGMSKTAGHVYTVKGSYTATLTVTDSGSGDSSTATATVTVSDVQETVAELTVSPTTVKTGAPVTFDASGSIAGSGVTITSYTFDFGDGSPVVTQATGTITHAYAAAGQYQLVVTVTDSSSHTSQAKSRVIVQPTPVAPSATHRGGGSLGFLTLLPLFVAAGLRRRGTLH